MYLERTWIYGNRIELRKYHTTRYGIQGEQRKSRTKPTAEAVARTNEKNAERKLQRLLIANFEQGDQFVTLTYRKEDRPCVEESKKILRRFFESLRKSYKKAGAELKYIITTEWNGKHIHHHLVVNDIPGFAKIVTEAWKYGGIHMTPLYPDHDYQGLAEYMIKETKETFRDPGNPYRQRYSCSRNLKKPVEKVRVIKANAWREEPKVPKKLAEEGYEIDYVETGVDAFGYPFMEYMMVKKDGKKTRRGRKPVIQGRQDG